MPAGWSRAVVCARAPAGSSLLTHGPAGAVQVYENAAINDSTLHSTGLPSNVARVIERCCSVCKYAPPRPPASHMQAVRHAGLAGGLC